MASGLHSPYPYQPTANGEAYTFTTNSEEEYIFYFAEGDGYLPDSELGKYASMFGFAPATPYQRFEKNASQRLVRESDPRIAETLVQALRDFFQDTRRIALYVCDTSDDHQRSRHILFRKWNRVYNDGTIIVEPICNGPKTYASLLYHKDNPLRHQIIQELPDFIQKYVPFS